MKIRVDDPRRADVADLLFEHLREMASLAPPESTHALDIESLSSQAVTFLTAREGHQLLGCGALSEIDRRHGEIKSMRTSKEHLRKGIASAILEHIFQVARQRSYSRLSLETGSMEAFEPARIFYGRFGFVVCRPFGKYMPDPNSVFMTRKL